jgi:hypothetical protein
MKKYTFVLLSLITILFVSCSKAADTPITQETNIQSEKISSGGILQTSRPLANPDSPSFSEIDIDFSHEYDKNVALSFLGGTFFDIESDGEKEFIITG